MQKFCKILMPFMTAKQHLITLSFQISVGTQITIGMGICQKSNKHRHPNYCRHGNFPKLSLELPFQYLYNLR